jgi:hypothetical protein
MAFDNFVDVLRRERRSKGIGNGVAVGHGDGSAGGTTTSHNVCALGFDAEDSTIRQPALNGVGGTGDQSAAAHRDDDSFEPRSLAYPFETERACA